MSAHVANDARRPGANMADGRRATAPETARALRIPDPDPDRIAPPRIRRNELVGNEACCPGTESRGMIMAGKMDAGNGRKSAVIEIYLVGRR